MPSATTTATTNTATTAASTTITPKRAALSRAILQKFEFASFLALLRRLSVEILPTPEAQQSNELQQSMQRSGIAAAAPTL